MHISHCWHKQIIYFEYFFFKLISSFNIFRIFISQLYVELLPLSRSLISVFSFLLFSLEYLEN